MGEGFYFVYDHKEKFWTIVAINDNGTIMFFEESPLKPIETILNSHRYKLHKKISLPKNIPNEIEKTLS